ncbi:unnamed protein product [Aphanomyces euteiches]
MNASDAQCFYSTAFNSCRKRDWGLCGYNWLAKVPVGLVWLVWFFAGTYALSQFGTLKFGANIHDALGQGPFSKLRFLSLTPSVGIAIALSQRKSTVVGQPRLLRYIKLCAILAEWPTFTFTPLTIALKVGAQNTSLSAMVNWNLSTAFEILGVVSAAGCGLAIMILRKWMKDHPSSDALLKKWCYPITFDLVFIPTISMMAHIGTCPDGLDHLVLENGATCACIDYFGYFWAVGFGGFVLLYCSAMYYKMHIEPHGTTMDFRFQTSFQIMMAMARTVNPLVPILVVLLDVNLYPARATPIACAFLVMVTYLLVYSYKTQPCIGSGRIPNNIRVVSFSSSVYTTTCVFCFCVTGNNISALYYSLLPLPAVWLIAWTINDRRAKRFYIPYLPIVQLLSMTATRPRLAGVIAALYVDPTKLHADDHEKIIQALRKIARTSEIDPLTRSYALQTLWFCHAKNFHKSKVQFGQPDNNDALPPKLWFKDRDNLDRLRWTKAGMTKRELLPSKQHKVKITSIDHLLDVIQDDLAAPAAASVTPVMMSTVSNASRTSRSGMRMAFDAPPVGAAVVEDSSDDVVPFDYLSSSLKLQRQNLVQEMEALQRPHVDKGYSVIRIRDKQWISAIEDPLDAVDRCDELFSLATDVLHHAIDSTDQTAVLEAALYLLRLYQARYLRLGKATYVVVVCSLCSTSNLKLVVDAVHTLYKLVVDDVVLSPSLWLQSKTCLDMLLCALDHPSLVTITKCALVAKAVLAAAEVTATANLFALLTPASIGRLRGAFLSYPANYEVSTALEDICMCLHRVEVSQGVKHRNQLHLKSKAILTPQKSITQSLVPSNRSGERSNVSRRWSLRVLPEQLKLPAVVTAAAAIAAPVPQTDASATGVQVSGATGSPKHQGGAKIQYFFVQSDVVQEIHRRRSIRMQFEAALGRAFKEADANKLTMRAMPPVAADDVHHKLPASYGDIMKLYAQPECALEDMLATAMDPRIKAFFETQVMAHMVIQ